ncbi:MAG: hypothetical protein OSB57_07390 [Planctomycetota bacterium]|nr:hypothetical protein [Planctomycetota bacterium]
MTYRLYDTETAEIPWEDSQQQSVQSDSSDHPIAALPITAIPVE